RWHVARHAECHRHIKEYFVTADAIVETPRLVLVPRIHRPFPRADIVVGEVIVEVPVPVRQQHVDGEIVDDLLDIEVLLEDRPLLVAPGTFELIDELDEVVVALMRTGLLLMLADEAVAEPLALVEVAIRVQPRVTQEGSIGLLDEQLEAERPTV